ncbi:protocadherin beta-4 [Columba livia]|uniref:Protocadherin beta-4 n=1 Tax=Columba livia TaxID=8932 RepID=A0A2I0LQT5_COLLI|nr:protocadherin beta-4 [Columba livia]
MRRPRRTLLSPSLRFHPRRAVRPSFRGIPGGEQPRVCARVRVRPLRYSVAEEGESGSVVGNVAEDAGLAPAQLSARRARLASEDGRQHFRLERGTGRLLVAERLDREELCGQAATCTLPFELVLANPLQFLRVEVTVDDINDHAPIFPEEQVTFKIPERSDPGSRFPLEGARDLDVGSNSIQAYSISPENEYFSVSFGNHSHDEMYVELVLEKLLDREEQAEIGFSLIAMDGGSPPRSGTIEIHIVVLDVNDNSPVFTQKVYFGKVLENAPEGSVVLSVVATDLDAGRNGDISYQFSQALSQSDSTFLIDPVSGEIKLTKPLDFEAAEKYELSVRATDGGGLSAICKVLVEVVDVNDNAPESLRPAYKNYYELVTVSTLDREETAQYILSVTAADMGSPPLTTTQTFTVDVSDVNDNAPVFNQTSYTMYVRENNVPTVLVGAVSAADADTGSNAKVTYSLVPAHPTEQPPCSCISVNSENGDVFVLRPLDYEQVKQIEVLVSASDAGSPALSSKVTVRLVMVDENDNVPLVLYPSQDSSPPSSELVPMSAEAGYLVTKVVAVDADSGQNSWLSYHLLRATDPGLFVVGAQSGEVRLRRPVTERDAAKQKLVVLVRDNGQPPLSATASLSALLLSDFSDVRITHSSLAVEDEGDSLTMYLIISLVFVSLLFLASMGAFVVHKACKRNELKGGHVLYGAGNLQSGLADAATAGTLPHPYCYEISLTTGSGNSEFKFLKPILPSLLPQHCTTGVVTDDQQDFPRDPITLEDAAPAHPGMVSVEQFNSLSFK